jgi:hypothetical protein
LNCDHQFEEDAAEVKLALSFVLEQCSSISSILMGMYGKQHSGGQKWNNKSIMKGEYGAPRRLLARAVVPTSCHGFLTRHAYTILD